MCEDMVRRYGIGGNPRYVYDSAPWQKTKMEVLGGFLCGDMAT